MNRFRDAIRQKDFVITAALPLRPATTSSEIKHTVESLAPIVDAIQIDDDRFAVGHMSPVAAASIVLENGVDAIMHLSCRDHNRIGLVADVLGAAALGVTTLVLNRGEKFTDSAIVRSKGVFEISAAQLINLACKIGSDSTLVDNPGFQIGSSITVFAPDEGWEAVRIKEKIDDGVRFLQSQPCLNPKLLRDYMLKLVELKVTHGASVIVEVPLLTSAKRANALKAIIKGAALPNNVMKRITSSPDPIAAGINACAETIAEAREIPGVSGVNLRYDGEPENIVAAIQQAALLRR